MLKLENVKNIIWDKDGTLTDVHLYWGEIVKRRAKALVKKYNLSENYYEKICKMLGLYVDTQKLTEIGPVGVLSREEILDKLHEYLLSEGVSSSKELNEKIFDSVHKQFLSDILDYVKLLPDVEDALNRFSRKGCKQYIITSDTSENAEKIAKYLKIDKYFIKIWGKNVIPYPKKSGKPAIILMEQENLNPEETLCIGDTKMDFDMAKNSNTRCVLTATGQIPKSTLEKYTSTVNNLSELEIV